MNKRKCSKSKMAAQKMAYCENNFTIFWYSSTFQSCSTTQTTQKNFLILDVQGYAEPV